jgi:general stress protein 26
MAKQREGNDIEKLGKIIKNVQIAMLTTAMPDGSLRSRPMQTRNAEFDGHELWFFTPAGAAKVDEVNAEHHVNIAYADPDKQRYASVSGTATVLRDRAKAKELWSPAMKAWFPKGLDDPDLALLRVRVQYAEFWEAPPSKVVQAVGFVKALTTGTRYEAGENKKLSLDGSAPPAAKGERATRQRTPGREVPASPKPRPGKREGDPVGAAAGIVPDRRPTRGSR